MCVSMINAYSFLCLFLASKHIRMKCQRVLGSNMSLKEPACLGLQCLVTEYKDSLAFYELDRSFQALSTSLIAGKTVSVFSC